MMKKRNALMLVLALLLCLLTACSTAPAETTAPPDTEPIATEPTVPPTTEPVAEEPGIPEDYVCLNDLIKGTGITIKTAGPKILLIEDGLTIVLSEARREAYRDQYIVGVMKGNPILENGKLYDTNIVEICFWTIDTEEEYEAVDAIMNTLKMN